MIKSEANSRLYRRISQNNNFSISADDGVALMRTFLSNPVPGPFPKAQIMKFNFCHHVYV